MRTILLAASIAVAAGLLQPAHTAQGQPDILLITLDTTRADRMGFLGSTRGLTPSMDALAKTATVFASAYAQAPITTVSHATILSGTYPPFHGVDDFGAPLPAAVPYLPDLLKASGYHTAAFVGSLILDPRNGTAPGFDRGFDVYDAGFRLRRPGEDRYATVERRGDEVTRRATAWIANTKNLLGGTGRPFFVWVHLFDPHDPYEPPSDLQARFAKEPYDGEIAFTDRQVGRLVAAAGRDATIVIAGDHGESLGDHGETTHGVFLYDATLRVPLIVRAPAGRGAGMRIATRVRLADIAPTILEGAGVKAPPAMQGRSLLPLMRDGAKAEDLPVYAESSYPRRAFGW
ncbi:MAG: sulfatase, partial [Vicinamibacterales bacterium]